jgi:hypothetical protein
MVRAFAFSTYRRERHTFMTINLSPLPPSAWPSVAKHWELSIIPCFFPKKITVGRFPDSGGNKEEIWNPPTRISGKPGNLLKVEKIANL